MRLLLYEHNMLNGFWFALIEFLLVAAVCLFLSILEVLHRHIFWSIAYFGIGVNAATICATVIEQMRRGERSNTWAETYWPKEPRKYPPGASERGVAHASNRCCDAPSFSAGRPNLYSTA